MEIRGISRLHIKRASSSVLISLVIHLAVGLIFTLYYPQLDQSKNEEELSVDFVKNVPSPKLKLKLRNPLKMKKYKPKRRENKPPDSRLSKSSRNKTTEVMKYSDRLLTKSVGVVNRKEAEFVPDIMTDAKLREAEASNISRMVSLGGRTDGRGVVTGRAVVKGEGRGSSLLDSIGDGDALGEGGGSLLDQLDIIKFLNEQEGPQNVAYCLDVSASMSAAGLDKLGLAIDALKDSLLMLKEHDKFNIITFAQKAESMSDEMLPANKENIKEVSEYLNQFTRKSVSQNLGTNLLDAILSAFKSDASAVILITDGIPVSYDSKQYYIETDPKKILQKMSTK